MATQTIKKGRGRPVKPVSFGVAKGKTFTLGGVMNRYNRKGASETSRRSRACVYNAIIDAIDAKRVVVAAHLPLEGRGHPNYQYRRVA